MTVRRPLAWGLAAATAVTLIAGCASGGTTTNKAAADSTAAIPPLPSGALEKTHIVVSTAPTTDAAGLYVAQYEHLFQQAGLSVTIQQAASDEVSINDQALHAGVANGQSADIVLGNDVSLIDAQYSFNGGLPTPGFLLPDSPDSWLSSDLYIVAEASVMQPGYVGLFVPPGSSVHSVADLEGKTIGINAPTNIAWLMISSFLEANGMPPNSVSYKYYSFPKMATALKSHKVQAAFLAEPYLTIAEQADGVSQLSNLDTGMSKNFPVASYAVSKQWAQQYPNTLQAFLHALNLGQQIADTDRAVTEKALAAEVPGITAKYATLLTMETYPIGQPDAAELQRVADDMQSLGLISGSMLGDPQPQHHLFQVGQMILPSPG